MPPTDERPAATPRNARTSKLITTVAFSVILALLFWVTGLMIRQTSSVASLAFAAAAFLAFVAAIAIMALAMQYLFRTTNPPKRDKE